jgi:NitT/TauT family transport system substrate-binding protein
MGLGVVSLPLLAACGTSTPAPAPTTAPTVATPTTVKVGIIGSTSDAGFFLADERGYFKEAGIEFQSVAFQTGPDQVPPAGNGQLDVATGAPSAGLFNAIARGVPLKIVADKGSQRRGFVYSSIVLRKDLLDGGEVKGWADLKGQKMAVAGLGNTGQMFLDKALQRGGLSWRDVELTQLSYADMGAALANRSIAGGVAIEPFRTQWPTQGMGGLLPDDDEIWLDQQAAVVMYGPQFVQQKGDVAKRLMVAYLRGVRDYNDAFTRNKGRDGVIDVLIERTALKDRAVYDKMGLPSVDPNGGVLEADLRAQQDWYLANQYQTERIDMQTSLDAQYSGNALEQLGRYQ